ncbi:MAG: response regulator [Desulfobacter sp.]
MKILVIDDEKPTLSMFRLFLSAYGYEVHTAENGEQGLAVFRECRPDIVFTDIRMPGMDGLEVLRRIRNHDAGCQVVIITGHGDMARALDALDLDASDFINKPVERQALNAALVRAEKRAGRTSAPAFSMEAENLGDTVGFRCSGKLSGTEEHALAGAGDSVAPGSSVRLSVDDDFSIDRQGLNRLTEFLRAMNEKGCNTSITGLSYNYLRFFEMAGIDKLARLEAAPAEEPGT